MLLLVIDTSSAVVTAAVHDGDERGRSARASTARRRTGSCSHP